MWDHNAMAAVPRAYLPFKGDSMYTSGEIHGQPTRYTMCLSRLLWDSTPPDLPQEAPPAWVPLTVCQLASLRSIERLALPTASARDCTPNFR